MTDSRLTPPQLPQDDEQLEITVRDTARDFHYPPTPDIAGKVVRRLHRRSGTSAAAYRLRWAAAVIVVVLTAMLAVPEVRAWVLEVIRIGAVRIIPVEPSTTPTRTPTLIFTVPATPAIPHIRYPTPSEATPLPSVLDMPGETTLAAAQAAVTFTIQLPTYPDDLGEPDRVFVNEWNDTVITLVWLKLDGSVRMSLELLDSAVIATKYFPYSREVAVQVNGKGGIWLEGVHQVYYFTQAANVSREVTQSVLIWTIGHVTYRLETDLTQDEAIRIAESLK